MRAGLGRMAVLGRIVCHTGRSTPVTEDVFAKELHGLDHAWPRGLVVVEEIAAHKQNVRLYFTPHMSTLRVRTAQKDLSAKKASAPDVPRHT